MAMAMPNINIFIIVYILHKSASIQRSAFTAETGIDRKIMDMASRVEAIASRVEVIALRLEVVASRLEAIATRLEAVASRLEATLVCWRPLEGR